MQNTYVKIIASTFFALFAFAANSVLCRIALGGNTIDAASFTSVRLVSGITILFFLIQVTQYVQKPQTSLKISAKGSWLAAAMLFIYAVAFSFGYLSLDTGTGALILFGAVQITMILSNVITGTRLHFIEWLGLGLAFYGFVYLILPSVTTPSITGFILMSFSGMAWAFYTLLGRKSENALSDTAFNFLRTSPFIVILMMFSLNNLHVNPTGIMLAVISGAIASGIGYFVWYIALSGLSVTQAAVLQLFVPIIAAIGGVVFTSETITLRLIESSILVLGGILMVILGKYYFTQQKVKNIN